MSTSQPAADKVRLSSVNWRCSSEEKVPVRGEVRREADVRLDSCRSASAEEVPQQGPRVGEGYQAGGGRTWARPIRGELPGYEGSGSGARASGRLAAVQREWPGQAFNF